MLILYGKEKNNLTVDLNKSILLIPENTKLTGEINIRGNIFEGKKNGNKVSIKALRDLFIFINKKKLNVSFERYNWNLTLASLLKLKYERKLIVKSIKDDHIHFNLDVFLQYND